MQVILLLLMLFLAGTTNSAVVLPRPPSSPNYIPQEYVPANLDNGKSGYSEKAMYQRTNVEKPDTQDYRFLEIDLRDADNVDSLDLHGLVQAVLETQHHQHQQPYMGQRRLDDDIEEQQNQTYPRPEVVPHSIFGVRDVGLGPNQRLFEPTSTDHNRQSFLQPAKDFSADEKLYYLKSSKPKVYVNFRGRTGNFRQDTGDSKITVRFEPAAFLRATPPYHMQEKKTKTPPKKYDPLIHNQNNLDDIRTTDYTSTSLATTTSSSTTENTMVTSSELPKQIPAPPSRVPSRSPIAHTTPVQRYTARRTDILPGYAFSET